MDNSLDIIAEKERQIEQLKNEIKELKSNNKTDIIKELEEMYLHKFIKFHDNLIAYVTKIKDKNYIRCTTVTYFSDYNDIEIETDDLKAIDNIFQVVTKEDFVKFLNDKINLSLNGILNIDIKEDK